MKLNENGTILYFNRAWLSKSDAEFARQTPLGFSIPVSKLSAPVVELLVRKNSRIFWPNMGEITFHNYLDAEQIRKIVFANSIDCVYLKTVFKGKPKPHYTEPQKPAQTSTPAMPAIPNKTINPLILTHKSNPEPMKQSAPATIEPTTKTPEPPASVAHNGKFQNEKNFEMLKKFLEMGENVLLWGPAGTGKTVMAIRACAGRPYNMLNLSAASTESSIRGLMYPDGYHASSVYLAMTKGEPLIIDEIDRADVSVLTLLNSILANREFQFPNGEHVKAADGFIVIATANTPGLGNKGAYTAAQKMDASTRERFLFLEVQYDEELERHLSLTENPEQGKEWASKCHKIRARAKELGDDLIISIRAIIRGAKMLKEGLPMDVIMESVIWKGIDKVRKDKLTVGLSL